MSETVNTNPTESAGERSATHCTKHGVRWFDMGDDPANPILTCVVCQHEELTAAHQRIEEIDGQLEFAEHVYRKELDARKAAESRLAEVEAQAKATRLATIEECAKVCEQWGNSKVERLGVNDELLDSAKASAWDALQCATAIRHLKEKS